MKLISEYNDSNITNYITEDKKGNKSHVIEGVFMQADKKNRNGRVYEKKILESAVNHNVNSSIDCNSNSQEQCSSLKSVSGKFGSGKSEFILL